MKKFLSLFLLLITLVAHAAFSSVILTEMNISSVTKAYGFYLGQQRQLKIIKEKYPDLTFIADQAQDKFNNVFEPSIKAIEYALLKFYGQKKFKELTTGIYSGIDNLNITRERAEYFIDVVKRRAKGEIGVSIISEQTLVVLLRSHPVFQKNPEEEFKIKKFRYTYTSDGSGKAKGIPFRIDLPRSWVAVEGKRPNIVQKFERRVRGGYTVFSVIVKSVASDPTYTQSECITEITTTKPISLLPDGAVYLDGGNYPIENLPGLWVSYRMNKTRGKINKTIESVNYAICYKTKLVMMGGIVTIEVNGKNIEGESISKYMPVFDQIANSLVLTDMYK